MHELLGLGEMLEALVEHRHELETENRLTPGSSIRASLSACDACSSSQSQCVSSAMVTNDDRGELFRVRHEHEGAKRFGDAGRSNADTLF